MPSLKPGICPSLTVKVHERLNKAKIKTVLDFTRADFDQLMTVSGLTYKEIIAIRKVLFAQYAAFPVTAADMLEEMLQNRAIFGTGCSNVDSMLNGGIFSGDLTEIIGPPATGKSQFCLSLAVHVALTKKQSVIYIDTNGAFTCLRIHEIAKSIDPSSEESSSEYQSRIHYTAAYDLFHLFAILEHLRSDMNNQTSAFHCNLRLLIIDSVHPLLAPLIGGKCSDGLGLSVQLTHLLKCLSRDYFLAVVITNASVRDGCGNLRAALGANWQHSPHVRLLITREPSSDNTRRLSVMKSSHSATGQSALIKISQAGIEPETPQ